MLCHKYGAAVLIRLYTCLKCADLFRKIHYLLLIKAYHWTIDRKSADLVRRS